MRIEAIAVSKGSHGAPLPETSFVVDSGEVTIVEAETGDRPVVLALIASGRMVPDSGTITLDGSAEPALLRERIALVDAPEISEPPADIRLSTALREELSYAGRSTSRSSILQTITDALHTNHEQGLTPETRSAAQLASLPMRDVPPALRIRLLAELALSRPGVEALVLSSPDRHGGLPTDWYTIALDLASRHHPLLIICGAPSAALLPTHQEAEAATPTTPHPAELPEPTWLPNVALPPAPAAGEGDEGSGVAGVYGQSPHPLHPQRPRATSTTPTTQTTPATPTAPTPPTPRHTTPQDPDA
ncbi:hypothetical protein SCB71_19135 [Herbiconiux sp. KACC 21604]|uniref:hypothetical protein n=1 Tax=unclassified Herbiconiux TaxID=2618217 RepID=UPI001490CA0A|nr:hypothetical protein [Herbiconiux sp. SALV-R1]QJU55157.1 hypothetical protein HL652_17070 [Herbiconiux sp. SALV-R1]WPO86312.1 hypothetical protein SCB71_19135 [Herbiconiux sp. KACC 21604]